MCCFHKGENNGACNRGCKDCLLYAKFFLMQLSVALGLHFGWGSQLNTSEMFWIDISRWMISSRCSWISVYLFWRTARAFEPLPFFCSIVALRCVHNPVNCPSVICSPRIAVLSSFGRETSLVNITYPGPYPHYCLHSHLLFCFYFQFLSLSLAFDPL